MRKSSNFILIISVFLICICGAASAKKLSPASKLMPPETVLLAEIKDYSQLEEQFEKTDYYKLLQDPSMSDFTEYFKTQWNKMLQEKGGLISDEMFDLENMPQGRLAAGLVMTEASMSDPNIIPIVLMAQCGESFEKIQSKIEAEVDKQVAAGAYKDVEEFRGADIVTVKPETGSEMNYSYIEDVVLAAGEKDLLKFVVAQIRGADSSDLAESSDYQKAMSAVGPYHDVDVYVNIRQLINSLSKTDDTGVTGKQFSSFGLDNVLSYATTAGVAREAGSNYILKGFLGVQGEKKGIVKMLGMKETTFDIPDYVPADTYSITYANIDPKLMFTELATMLSAMNPMFGSMLYTPIVPPNPDGSGGLQIKTGVIDHLGNRLVVSDRLKKPFKLKQSHSEYLFGIAVANRKELEKSLDLLHTTYLAGADPESKREFMGYTIYEVNPMAIMPFFGGGGMQQMAMNGQGAAGMQMPTPAFTVTDTYWILGTAEGVESAIREMKKDGLQGKEWFKKAKDMVPAAGAATYNDDKRSTEAGWWLLKNMSKGKNDAGGGLFDFSLLPEFSTVEKYFGISAGYFLNKNDGIYIEHKDKN